MFFASDLIDIGHFAASGSARDVVFVETDFDAAPGVFVVSLWASDDQIRTEAGSRETGGAFYFGHFGFDVADTGEVDKVKGILIPLVQTREMYACNLQRLGNQ
jgi:hypothetical protein